MGIARQAQGDRLELEQEIVAEGAREGELVVVLAFEFVRQSAEDGEDGRLFAAIFFRKDLAASA